MSIKKNSSHKTGILLCNMGTPNSPTPQAIRQFLNEFLSDSRVIEKRGIRKLFWWIILHGIILPFRPKRIVKLYKNIWTKDGSPLLVFSDKQAKKLQHRFSENAIITSIGMRYGNPCISSELRNLRDREIDTLFVLPLYPQYSATTTGAIFDAVAKELMTWRNIPTVQMLSSFFDNSHYIEALVKHIQQFWSTNSPPEHLLMSFHGIPIRYCEMGDPYHTQCLNTAHLIADALKLSSEQYSVCFQSRMGRAPWTQPYTENTLRTLPHRGIKSLDVICPGFMSDCLETLEEIAIQGKTTFLKAGGKEFRYIPALNDSTACIDLLENLVMNNRRL